MTNLGKKKEHLIMYMDSLGMTEDLMLAILLLIETEEEINQLMDFIIDNHPNIKPKQMIQQAMKIKEENKLIK